MIASRGKTNLNPGSWERLLAGYLRLDLLILDDFGVQPLQPPAPKDLYDVITVRYEPGSILKNQ